MNEIAQVSKEAGSNISNLAELPVVEREKRQPRQGLKYDSLHLKFWL